MTASVMPTAISLSEYAEFLGLPDLFWWGVRRGGVTPPRALFYSGEDRRKVRSALDRSVGMIEDRMQVKLYKDWIEGEVHPYSGTNPVRLRRKHYIEAGVKNTRILKKDAVVTYAGENGAITCLRYNVASTDEVRVYYNSTMQSGPEPMEIELDTKTMTITFPRERLLEPALMSTGVYDRNSQYQPPAWETDGNFVTVLTVAQVTNDPSDQASIQVSRSCRELCTRETQVGCVVVEQADIGWIDVHPAAYCGGSWSRGNYLGRPEYVTVNYRSGLQILPEGMTDAIIRLAHSLLPAPPCPVSSSEPSNFFWKRDREITGGMTRERQNCPWGLYDGAWYAWNYVADNEYNFAKGGGWLGSVRKERTGWERSVRWLW